MVRKIITRGTTSLAVKGFVTDSMGAPIKGVVVAFNAENGLKSVGNRSATSKIIKMSAEKGGFNVKALAAGVYQVSLTKEGYKPLTISIVVNDGELADIKAQMEKC